MDYFKSRLFGYSKNEVERYFNDLESKHRSFLTQKKSELNLTNEEIKKITIEINSLTKELDTLNKKKDNLINYVNNRIAEIERLVNDRQAESQEIEQAALQQLTMKRNDLIKVQNCINKFKNDLTFINYRQKQAKQLLNK